MITYVVNPVDSDQSAIVNADDPIEAVKLAIARRGVQSRHYRVYDHDLNATVVEVNERQP
jgi:hypothetical protein